LNPHTGSTKLDLPGKNRLTRAFEDLFNPAQTLVIEGDDYHRWKRGHDTWADYTHMNRRANDLTLESRSRSWLRRMGAPNYRGAKRP
jgi:hypothetical protein